MASPVPSLGEHAGVGASSSTLPPPGSSTPQAELHPGGVSLPGSSAAADPASSAVPPSSPLQRPVTQLQRGIRQPKQYSDGTIRYGQVASVSDESPTLKHALNDKNWKNAMDVEFDALLRNKTWHLVPPLKGKNVIDCKWVYKIKRWSDGEIDRYKARLVAKGI